MELATFVRDGSIDANPMRIGTEPRMRIGAPFAAVFRGQMKLSQIDTAIGRHMKEVRRLKSFLATRIRVVQYPFVARQVTKVPRGIQDSASDFSDLATSGPILEKKVAPSFPPFRLGKNVFGITPDKMGHVTVLDYHPQITSIQVGCHHPRLPTSLGKSPSMQRNESRAVRIE